VLPGPSETVTIAGIKALGGTFLAKGSAASWSPDGTRLAFGKYPVDSGIGILHLTTAQTSTLVDAGRDPAWSPKEGKVIAYVRGREPGGRSVWWDHPAASLADHRGRVPRMVGRR